MEELPEIELSWKRPTTVPFPNVWHRFESRPTNGKTYKIRIEDLTAERYEETLEFMMKYYFPEEPLSASSKLLEDEVSTAVYQYVISKVMENNISVLAVLDNDEAKPEIVGLQILSVASKDDPPLAEVPGESIGKMKQMYNDIRINADPFEKLECNAYLHDWGLCVKTEYRGLNIGYNILLSLEKISKAFGITASMIMFTRIQSQILAERAGFKLYNEIVYRDYKDENGEIIFPVEGTISLKLMGIKYQ